MGQLTFDLRHNVIVLRAKCESHGGRAAYVRMALDTGASLTVLPWSTAEALGWDPVRSVRRVPFMTGSGMEAAPLLTAEAIEVLGVRVEHVPVLCHDLPQRSLVDGLLGLSFLRHCRLALDFGAGLLELSKVRP